MHAGWLETSLRPFTTHAHPLRAFGPFPPPLAGTCLAVPLRMSEQQVLIANIASNLVALLLLLVCWRWRRVGRALFFAVFLWAAQLNLRLALTRPAVYLDYARWAIGPYRDFILGPFARHITPLVAAIALAQLAVAILLALRGRATQLGLLGAILFLLAIAPLGRGSAFPFSLTASLAASLLLRPFPTSLPTDAASLLRRRHRA
jgi:hypothetical protein